MKTILITLFLSLFCLSAFAYDGITYYGAKLSNQDHYNSKGIRLTTVLGIVQQDRANVHKFGKKDPQDEVDSYYTTLATRQNISQSKLRITPALKKKILSGQTVNVTVWVFEPRFIEVTEGFPSH